MKKSSFLITFSVLAFFLLAIFVPSMVLGENKVQAASDVTIRGNLYKVPAPGNALVPLVNQPVKVLCGGVTKTANTDGNGLYTVVFNEPGCIPASFVSTQSKYNNSTITREVQVSNENRATINLFY